LYAGFILVLRHRNRELQRPVGPLFDSTLAAAAVALVIGLALRDIELAPSWPAHAWLLTLALTCQVAAWLLLSGALPRLPAGVGSLLLTLQPVGSVLLGVVLLAEAPTALQLAGTACILAGVVAGAAGRLTPRRAAPGRTSRPPDPLPGAPAARPARGRSAPRPRAGC
jgi:drug/metabolite transporter (DMT)-like permease